MVEALSNDIPHLHSQARLLNMLRLHVACKHPWSCASDEGKLRFNLFLVLQHELVGGVIQVFHQRLQFPSVRLLAPMKPSPTTQHSCCNLTLSPS